MIDYSIGSNYPPNFKQTDVMLKLLSYSTVALYIGIMKVWDSLHQNIIQ